MLSVSSDFSKKKKVALSYKEMLKEDGIYQEEDCVGPEWYYFLVAGQKLLVTFSDAEALPEPAVAADWKARKFIRVKHTFTITGT